MSDLLNIFAGIILLTTTLLGIANFFIFPFGMWMADSLKVRAIIVFLYLAMATMCYFLARAGFVADEQGIGGNQVPPFYGTEWYCLIFLGANSLIYQILLIRKARAKSVARDKGKHL